MDFVKAPPLDSPYEFFTKAVDDELYEALGYASPDVSPERCMN
jgi:hypothetical protein